MPTLSTPTRAGIAIAIAALSAPLLTGCVGDLVNRGVEEALEGATGGDVSLGDLPEGFPTSIPLIEGDIQVGGGGSASGGEGWVVVISSSAADPLAEAASALEGAGFTEDTTASGAGMSAKVYSNAEYLVLVAGEGGTVSYTVTPQAQ